jgi:arginine decarboxylase
MVAHVTETNLSPEQASAPYSEALQALASEDWGRLHVPAHQGKSENAPGVAQLVGEQAMKIDFPMLFSGVDQTDWVLNKPGRITPIMRAQDLAAELWGASRVWFITTGASGANHIATNVARGLGKELIVQRSVHSSVIDGMTHVGITPHFIRGAVDLGLGASHGVTPEQVAKAISEHPDASAVYLVSPSYFGAVSDIESIAKIAHESNLPLIVDEAWGSHFGLHKDLPANAVKLGADLVISSTHKGAGSLTQSAMLQLGNGPIAHQLATLVDRVVRSYQSTSTSAILLASLDETRRFLANEGRERIAEALQGAQQLRTAIQRDWRFRDATPDVLATPDAVANDPFKVVIDTRGAGITGGDAQYLLIRDHRIYCELATPGALVLLIGATSPPDVAHFLEALASLPRADIEPERPLKMPGELKKAMELDEAFFSPVELVHWSQAAGRISADSLAAYPPGVPNVLPGERLTEEAISYLRGTAEAPSGYVRGAADPALEMFQVVAEDLEHFDPEYEHTSAIDLSGINAR